MWGICTVECFPVPAGIALSLLGCVTVHRWVFTDTEGWYFRVGHNRAICPSGWNLVAFSQFSSGSGSTCGHPFSCGTARTICEFSNCHRPRAFREWQSAEFYLPLVLNFPLHAGLFLSFSCWIRTEPCHWCPPQISKLLGLQQMWSIAEPRPWDEPELKYQP